MKRAYIFKVANCDLKASSIYLMPIISSFFGIIIAMYYRDHAPPHFHARYGDQEVIVEIATGKTIGEMSGRALSILQEWRIIHTKELLNDWRLSEQNRPLKKISPLE